MTSASVSNDPSRRRHVAASGSEGSSPDLHQIERAEARAGKYVSRVYANGLRRCKAHVVRLSSGLKGCYATLVWFERAYFKADRFDGHFKADRFDGPLSIRLWVQTGLFYDLKITYIGSDAASLRALKALLASIHHGVKLGNSER